MVIPSQLAVAAVAPGFAAHGLPAPERVVRFEPDGGFGRYHVVWPAGTGLSDALLVVEFDPRRRLAAPVELAAVACVGGALPVPRGLQVPGLGASAVLWVGPWGTPVRDPVRLVDVLIELQSRFADGWGDLVVSGAFMPSEASWTAYVTRRLGEALAAAEAGGCGLGGLGRAVYDRGMDRRDAMSGATFGLVHGDLVPKNVRVDGSGAVVSVVGWQDALLGDPLLDWASAIEAPAGALEAGLVGRPPPWASDAGAVARLEAYVCLRALERLAECGRPWLDGDGGRERAGRLEAARTLAHEALTADRVSGRLRRAVPGAARGPRPRPDPSRSDVLARRVLEALRYPVPTDGLLHLTAALASTRLSADAVVEQTSPALRGLGPQQGAWASAPIPDRHAWRAELVARALADARPAAGLALALLAVGLEVIDGFDGEVDDGVLRGLARLAVVDAPSPGWRDAIVGLAAVGRLGGDATALLDGLTGLPEDADGDPEDLVDGLAFVEWWTSPGALWTPLLAWALPHLPDALQRRVAGQLTAT